MGISEILWAEEVIWALCQAQPFLLLLYTHANLFLDLPGALHPGL